jgi:hypothetical protein
MGIAVLALALALVVPQSVLGAEQLKRLHIQLVDDETGQKVAGECAISTNVGTFTFYETNAGGTALVTLDADARRAFIDCSTGAGFGSASVRLRENGTTRVTIVV